MPSYALYMMSYPQFMTTILNIYDIPCTVFRTSHALYMTCHLLCMISQSLYVWQHTFYLWHHTQYIYRIISNIYDTTSILLSLQHNYTWHLTHYNWPHVHCICVITSTLSMISQPINVWYHIQYLYDVLSTIFITSYPLFMTSQHCVLMTPHSAYVWHTLH